MNKIFTFLILLTFIADFDSKSNQFIANQGQVSFFSYTPVENIEAQNNQVLSILDVTNNEIAISMLMRAFVFKKALMREHFNESYIESDIYPKANFEGKIINFDATLEGPQTRIVRGTLTIHGVSKNVDIKATIAPKDDTYVITGDFDVVVKDFDIKIPPILASNIAKTINVKFIFEYKPYEE